MLNVAFLDPAPLDYDVATPYERPLGGHQSALGYLAVELAKRGCRVTFYGGTTRPCEVLGVRCLSHSAVPPGALREPLDAFIVVGGPADACLSLRPQLAESTPLVLWTGHAADQPVIQGLQNLEARKGWDAIVCVSDWHRRTMIEAFGLDPGRTFVLRNAIAPCFEGLFQERDALMQAKSGLPVMAYTSTPFRGLNLLLPIYEAVRGEVSTVELAVFSSMQVYLQNENADPYASLYDRCRSTPGVRYVGSLPQPKLAHEMKSMSILAYPNTFEETSCIAVTEALAAGLLVVTSNLAALPETTMGFGILVPPVRGPGDVARFVQEFRDTLVQVLSDRAHDLSGFAAARFNQVQAVNGECTWHRRAEQWIDAISSWQRASSAGINRRT